MKKNAAILTSIVVTMSLMPAVLLHNVTASGLAEPVTRVVQRTVEGETSRQRRTEVSGNCESNSPRISWEKFVKLSG